MRTPIRFPVLKPLLPTADKLLPHIQEIDENRWYTNYGPLVQRFEARLSEHFAVAANELTTSANATLALSQTLLALEADIGTACVMPSWTFVATPAAAIWAGLEPCFVDVDPATWVITPEQVRRVAQTRRVGAVIVVSAFGAPLNLAAWDEFSSSTGIPVVIDAAAGFDGFGGCGRALGRTPVVVSLHATKVSGIGEGAAVVTRDHKLASTIRSLGNFGFDGSRDAIVRGTNAKMSEYTAAIGLAFLSEWPARRARWSELTDTFAHEVKSIPELKLAPGFNEGWVSSYGLVELPAWISADTVMRELSQWGVETRQWWGKGCHRHAAYQNCSAASLDETDRLGRQTLGLPFWLGMTNADVREIFTVFKQILRTASPVPEQGANAHI
ncbi:DegT/DnrJ/EryC1/StrS family aminotransferase [Paraburkholderia sp. SIMBA_049]